MPRLQRIESRLMTDIIDSINRHITGDKEMPASYKTRFVRARDEIVRIRAELESLLIENNRLAADCHTLAWSDARLRKELYELKHCQCGYDDFCQFARERDAALAELESVKTQKPFCFVSKWSVEGLQTGELDAMSAYPDGGFEFAIPLYKAAGAKQ